MSHVNFWGPNFAHHGFIFKYPFKNLEQQKILDNGAKINVFIKDW